MKLKRIRLMEDQGPSIAVFSHGTWIPLKRVLSRAGRSLSPEEEACATDMIALLKTGADFRQTLTGLVEAYVSSHGAAEESTDETPLLPFEPRSYRDFMLYEKHAIDAARGYTRRFMPFAYRIATTFERITGRTFPPFKPNRLWYQRPVYYMGNHLNFVTDNHPIAFPPYSTALDYELELGTVIVRPLRDASPDQALAAIGGFAVFNDFSARDVQVAEMRSGFGPVKAKHFINAVSTVVVSADEILPHVGDLQAWVRINGQTIVQTSTAGMHYSLGEAVAFASLGEQLHPGEFIATGTLPGGSGMENGTWLRRGDVIELEIAKIGTLTNPVT